MFYTFFVDCHIGMWNAKCEKELPKLTRDQVVAENMYSLGDNYDLHYCSKQNLSRLESLLNTSKVIFKGRHVSGNHCCQGITSDYALSPCKGILFTHGDIAEFGIAKALELRCKPRAVKASIWKKLGYFFHGSIPDCMKDGLVQMAHSYQCKVIVAGHSHTGKIFDKVIDGVRVICLPRGKTKIDI